MCCMAKLWIVLFYPFYIASINLVIPTNCEFCDDVPVALIVLLPTLWLICLALFIIFVIYMYCFCDIIFKVKYAIVIHFLFALCIMFLMITFKCFYIEICNILPNKTSLMDTQPLFKGALCNLEMILKGNCWCYFWFILTLEKEKRRTKVCVNEP